MLERETLLILYKRLYQTYGPQHWWPADTPFEVMVGAVLTQNTAWTNVEKAIASLKRAHKLELVPMSKMTEVALADLIRPSGYFNVKARRLQQLCGWLISNGGIESLSGLATIDLRKSLLTVHGIGPETADDILLYAFYRPVFVIDTYTRRLLKKLDLIKGEESYEALRAFFELALEPEHGLFNEYHALIVRHAKERCVAHDMCRHCLVEAAF